MCVATHVCTTDGWERSEDQAPARHLSARGISTGLASCQSSSLCVSHRRRGTSTPSVDYGWLET